MLRLIVKNFQILRKADLHFIPGINVIVGSNNSGKSAIVRALYYALFNQRGTDFITLNTKACTVGIEFDGHRYSWTKDAKSNTQVILDGEKYSTLGQGPVADVLKALNFGVTELSPRYKVVLNFHREMDPPFLHNASPAEMFNLIGMSSESERLDQVLRSMGADCAEMKEQVTRTEGGIDAIKRRLLEERAQLKALEKKEEPSQRVVQLAPEVQNFVDLSNCLYGLERGYEELDGERAVASRVTSILEVVTPLLTSCDALLQEAIGLETVITLMTRVDADLNQERELLSEITASLESADRAVLYLSQACALESECEKLQKICATLESTTSEFELKRTECRELSFQIEKLDRAEPFFKEAISLEGQCSELARIVNRLEQAEEQVSSENRTLEKLAAEYAELEVRLKKFSTCPLCGTALSNSSEVTPQKGEGHESCGRVPKHRGRPRKTED